MPKTGQGDFGVREQYEKFPYPPIPFLALPKVGQGENLRYELGVHLARKMNALHTQEFHHGIRILVAGGGTVEPLVVAQAHPHAQEIVAVDLSQTSLDRLKRRCAFAKVARFPISLPPIRFVRADLFEWLPQQGGSYDYIIASNVIHHVSEPGKLLKALASQLSPGGILRMVTYPKASRIWMRLTGAWLRHNGITPLTPNLLIASRKVISLLPLDHPVSLCFKSHLEAKTATGIVDAFLHECETPLSPLEWQNATQLASLQWLGETQSETSRSTFLQEIVPELQTLTPWESLQILDDLLEVCANPVLWFKQVPKREITSHPSHPLAFTRSDDLQNDWKQGLPPAVYLELKESLLRIQNLLTRTGVSLETVLNRFKTEVGPRVHPMRKNQVLKGLALSDYDSNFLLNARF